MNPYAVLLASLALIACGAVGSSDTNGEGAPVPAAHGSLGRKVTGDGQLTEYVRRIFQDSRGRYWFGSNGDGIYRYDPSAAEGAGLLEVFSTGEGLAGAQVTGILEDRQGNIWISTDGGVSRFDDKAFTNYTTADGLPSKGCWSIFDARDGTIWVGTAVGLCRLEAATDGSARGRFMPLALPTGAVPDLDASAHWTACITQDRQGDLWFATRGAGAFTYDGRSFPRFTTANGLEDHELACILMDSKDRVWISSMNAGVAVRDGSTSTRFAIPDIGNNEVWTVFEDRDGHIWFSSEGFGVYRCDPSALGTGSSALRNYSKQQGLGVLAVQTIHQDRDGKMWFGGGGGLYRLDGDSMVHVRRNGPWR